MIPEEKHDSLTDIEHIRKEFAKNCIETVLVVKLKLRCGKSIFVVEPKQVVADRKEHRIQTNQ